VTGEAGAIYRLAARMSAYYVIAIVVVVGAVVLSAIGLTREDFPPNVRVGRTVMAGTLLAVIAGVIALLATTDKEHPREEAAHAAAEKAAEEKGGKPGGEEGAPPPAGGGETTPVVEKEFSIVLEAGDQLAPGPHTFAVANEGKIQHDLAIEGNGLDKEPKTPLIDPGKTADLKADLKAGKYKFYCTVPGHEESGMATDVTVR
jgi:plastocyanin